MLPSAWCVLDTAQTHGTHTHTVDKADTALLQSRWLFGALLLCWHMVTARVCCCVCCCVCSSVCDVLCSDVLTQSACAAGQRKVVRLPALPAGRRCQLREHPPPPDLTCCPLAPCSILLQPTQVPPVIECSLAKAQPLDSAAATALIRSPTPCRQVWNDHDFVLSGYCWVGVWYVVFCFDQCYIKHIVDTVSFTSNWGRVYCEFADNASLSFQIEFPNCSALCCLSTA